MARRCPFDGGRFTIRLNPESEARRCNTCGSPISGKLLKDGRRWSKFRKHAKIILSDARDEGMTDRKIREGLGGIYTAALSKADEEIARRSGAEPGIDVVALDELTDGNPYKH